MDKTSTGMNANVAGLLCYVLGWVSGIVFLVIEKESKFVRFHALQSIWVFGILTVASIILGFIPIIGAVLGWVIWILGIVLWILLMIKAYQGAMYKIPFVGNIAERQAG